MYPLPERGGEQSKLFDWDRCLRWWETFPPQGVSVGGQRGLLFILRLAPSDLMPRTPGFCLNPTRRGSLGAPSEVPVYGISTFLLGQQGFQIEAVSPASFPRGLAGGRRQGLVGKYSNPPPFERLAGKVVLPQVAASPRLFCLEITTRELSVWPEASL